MYKYIYIYKFVHIQIVIIVNKTVCWVQYCRLFFSMASAPFFEGDRFLNPHIFKRRKCNWNGLFLWDQQWGQGVAV